MRIPIARYSITEITAMLIITVAMGYVFFIIYPVLIIIPLILLGYTLYFFRDPERNIPEVANAIVSPADGKIIEIKDVNENIFIKESAVKISIFLSVFNVHMNRAPYDGRVSLIDYRKGKFLVAYNAKASEQNERNLIGLICENRMKILVKQIAGIIAQRIVCDVQENQEIQKGMRIGMIKFGSRTEIFIPKNKIEKINIQLNDMVKGGETILALIKNESKN